jgi:hypothetical protein
MLINQNNKCVICKCDISKHPCVDHDHETGKIRGLLCLNCNHAIGFFRENVKLLEKVIIYLSESEKYTVPKTQIKILNKTKEQISKSRRLKYIHKITLEQFYQMLEDQNFKCKICDRNISEHSRKKNSALIDHNHKSNSIRGLLCGYCNVGVGKFFDNVEIIKKSIEYLRISGQFKEISHV